MDRFAWYGRIVIDGLFLYGVMTLYWMLFSVPLFHQALVFVASVVPGTIIPHAISYVLLIAVIYLLIGNTTDVKRAIVLGLIWTVVHGFLDTLYVGIAFASYALASYLILTTYALILVTPAILVAWRDPATTQPVAV